MERETQIANKLMLAFEGYTPPAEILEWLADRGAAGFTLFREYNVETPAQVRALSAHLQAAARQRNPGGLLIAADQEGGQLLALGAESTQFAGNMALGATGDTDRAYRVGRATGLELAAMGININYAPVCDLNTNPYNPSLGIRAFSDDPTLAAGLAGALVAGMQSAGVAATLKHFPGKGAAQVDSHFQLPVIQHDRNRLEQVELAPFLAGMEQGAQLIMTGHFALPKITGRSDLPATLDPAVMTEMVRDELHFAGVIITDALDMGAIAQGAGQIVDAVATVRAGVDLLLLTADPEAQERIYAGLNLAYSRLLISPQLLETSAQRIKRLQHWVRQFPQPGLEVVGCAEHQALARQLAEQSITLVRNDAELLPLRLPAEARVLVLVPETENLTPADTSSFQQANLGEELRRYHRQTEILYFTHRPDETDIAVLTQHATGYDLVILGTINASMNPAQTELARRVLAGRAQVITVALRTPYDLGIYPQSSTHICTYGVLKPSIRALARALVGEIPFRGRLPVTIPGLYTLGSGITSNKG